MQKPLWPAQHTRVRRVHYPKQTRDTQWQKADSGFGGMVSFVLDASRARKSLRKYPMLLLNRSVA